MKTLKEIRLEYIRLVLEESGWDFGKACRILKISESTLRREVRALLDSSKTGEGTGVRGAGRSHKKK